MRTPPTICLLTKGGSRIIVSMLLNILKSSRICLLLGISMRTKMMRKKKQRRRRLKKRKMRIRKKNWNISKSMSKLISMALISSPQSVLTA